MTAVLPVPVWAEPMISFPERATGMAWMGVGSLYPRSTTAWRNAAIWHTLFFIIAGMEAQAYRARRPKLSPLWQCLDAHFDTFLDIYPEAYEQLRVPATDHPGGRGEIHGLRGFCQGFRPRALRSLRPRVFAAVLVQGPLVLPPRATRRRCSSSARCWPRPSSRPCRTGISRSRSPRCCVRISGFIAGSSRNSAASPTGAWPSSSAPRSGCPRARPASSWPSTLVRKEERHFPAKIQAGIISDSFGQGTPFLIACDCETEKPSEISLTTSL